MVYDFRCDNTIHFIFFVLPNSRNKNYIRKYRTNRKIRLSQTIDLHATEDVKITGMFFQRSWQGFFIVLLSVHSMIDAQ